MLRARRVAGLLSVFEEGQLRFEGHPRVQAQNCLKTHAVGQNKNRKMKPPLQNSPLQAGGIFHGAHQGGKRRKHLQEESDSKRPRAFPANHNSEGSVLAALRGAWYPPHGNFHPLRPMYPLAGNSDWRKESHRPAPRRDPGRSPGSEPVPASSRFEFAWPSTSCCYATPLLAHRQLSWFADRAEHTRGLQSL
jgi:hypothetical protein